MTESRVDGRIHGVETLEACYWITCMLTSIPVIVHEKGQEKTEKGQRKARERPGKS
jgi:hypothetical protein